MQRLCRRGASRRGQKCPFRWPSRPHAPHEVLTHCVCLVYFPVPVLWLTLPIIPHIGVLIVFFPPPLFSFRPLSPIPIPSSLYVLKKKNSEIYIKGSFLGDIGKGKGGDGKKTIRKG